MVLKIYRAVAQRFKVFANRQEMNEHVQTHVFASGKQLHRNARAILNMISQHSVRYGGVSWLSEATIAKTLGIHIDTVKRAIKRLQTLKIGRIEVVEVSGITLTYFVLNRFEIAEDLLLVEDETSLDTSSVEPTIDDTKHLEARENKEEDIYTDESDIYISEFVEQAKAHSLPDQVIKKIAPKIKGLRFTVEALRSALVSFTEQYQKGCIGAVDRYFATVLQDKQGVCEFNRVTKQNGSTSNHPKPFPFFNWLEA
jgi:DNA-binding transcriptional regulator YhcF (GntR family)